MKTLNSILACTITLALTSSGGRADAQLPPAVSASPDEALSDTARELFTKGVKASQQQRWDQCRAAFLAALGIKKHPQIAGNLALCELRLGLHRDAAEHISFFLSTQRKDTPEDRKAAGEAVLREASAKVTTVRIQVDVAGSDVLVDGRLVGVAPLASPTFLDPGQHVVEARRDGYPSARASVEARAGASVDLALKLKQSRSPVPGIVAGGVGVVAAAVGIGFAVAGGSKGSDADALLQQMRGQGKATVVCPAAPECGKLKDMLATRDTDLNVGVGMLVVGGAAVVAGATYLLWPSSTPREQRSSMTLVPVATPGGGGLWVSGSF